MATKSANIQVESIEESILATIERRPLPAALLRIKPIAEPEASTTRRWVSIVAGVVALVGLIIGGQYVLSQRSRMPVMTAVAPLTNWLGEPSPVGTEPLPMADPTSQLSVDRRLDTSKSAPDQTAMEVVEQSPIPLSDQPLQPLGSEPMPVQETTTPAAAQPPVPAPIKLPQPVVEHEPRYITVGEGQSLIRIAHANHVPASAIAAANHLKPPYPLKAGSRLLMPDSNAPADQDLQASSDDTPIVPTHPGPRMGRVPRGIEPH